MKSLIKPIGLIALFMCSVQGFAQNNDWKIGIGTGYMNYYGDLTPELGPVVKDHYKLKTNGRELSYGVFLEKQMSGGTSFIINGNMGSFSGNDLTASDSTYFDRSLNFKTDVRDLSGTLHFRTDNGSLFEENALIAPYFFIGVGVTQFEVFADLKDNDGNTYDYGNGEVEQDGTYETNVSDLKVEKSAKQTIMNIPFGAGVRFNTGKKWCVDVQTDIKYMFTDYVDDVAQIYRDDFESDLQKYASKPNPRYNEDTRGKFDGIKNDLYAFTSVSLKYKFGKKKSKRFVPPIFPPSGSSADLMNNVAVQNNNAESVQQNEVDAQAQAVEVQVEVVPTQEEIEAEINERVEAKLAEQKAAEEIEIEEEVVIEAAAQETMPVATGTPVFNGNNGGAYNGSKYDPTVEMLKLEVDRLRSANSNMQNQGQIDELKREINQLKGMMGMPQSNNGSANGYNNNNAVDNNGAVMNGNNNNNVANSQDGQNTMNNPTSGVSQNSSNGLATTANNNQSNAENAEEAPEKKKKGLKKIFGKKTKEEKAAKKAKKAAKKASKEGDENTSASEETKEEKKGGYLSRFKRNKDQVRVEEYAFNFVGDSFEVGGELKAQLKKIAKKAEKSSSNKVVIGGETIKANQAKTNTIAVKLAQILAEEYGVDAGKISYDVRDIKSSPSSTSETQKVSVKVIY